LAPVCSSKSLAAIAHEQSRSPTTLFSRIPPTAGPIPYSSPSLSIPALFPVSCRFLLDQFHYKPPHPRESVPPRRAYRLPPLPCEQLSRRSMPLQANSNHTPTQISLNSSERELFIVGTQCSNQPSMHLTAVLYDLVTNWAADPEGFRRLLK
ncbi:hypothetical protein GOP47_0009535, partial [Adiantum capillus-veneris]